MTLVTCKHCVPAQWERTEKGNIKRDTPGSCTVSYPLLVLPICVKLIPEDRGGIWSTDRHDCPFHELR